MTARSLRDHISPIPRSTVTLQHFVTILLFVRLPIGLLDHIFQENEFRGEGCWTGRGHADTPQTGILHAALFSSCSSHPEAERFKDADWGQLPHLLRRGSRSQVERMHRGTLAVAARQPLRVPMLLLAEHDLIATPKKGTIYR